MERISWIAALFLLLFFTACTKEEVNEAAQETTQASELQSGSSGPKLAPPGGGGMLCLCPGYEVVEGTDLTCEWSGDNCTKIVNCPCPNKDGERKSITRQDIKTLDNAIENGRIQDYFQGEKWRKLFPRLLEDQESLTDLRNGDLTLTTQTRDEGKRLSYMAVPPDVSSDRTIEVEDIRFCLGRPIGEE